MSKRHGMNRRGSERNFSRHSGVHPKNNLRGGSVMRGGIRL